MSRIGKKVIVLPTSITLNFDPISRVLVVKGPLGELTKNIHPCVTITQDAGSVTLTVTKENDTLQRAIWGTTRAIINNLIIGVSTGFSRQLELNGVGFKMELASDKLTLFIGFSHSVIVDIPSEIKLTLNKNQLSGTSIDNEMIGNFFANIHNRKPADVYKHKGFKMPGRFYRKKVVKKTK